MPFPDLYLKTPTELSDEELLALVQAKHTAEPVPPCSLCGAKLTISSAGGGRATVWACDGLEEGPGVVWKPGRTPADEHYARSRFTQFRSGDSHVLELVKRFRERA